MDGAILAIRADHGLAIVDKDAMRRSGEDVVLTEARGFAARENWPGRGTRSGLIERALRILHAIPAHGAEEGAAVPRSAGAALDGWRNCVACEA